MAGGLRNTMNLSPLPEGQQLSTARDLCHMSLGSSNRISTEVSKTDLAEHAVKSMSTDCEKTVAYLYNVINNSSHTIDGLRNLGFSEEVASAVDSVTKARDESFIQCVLRARKNIVGRKVMLEYLRLSLKFCVSNRALVKYSRAVVALEG